MSAATDSLEQPEAPPKLYAYINTWLELQREAGVIDELYRYWILGEGARRKTARWSVVRDVMGWVD